MSDSEEDTLLRAESPPLPPPVAGRGLLAPLGALQRQSEEYDDRALLTDDEEVEDAEDEDWPDEEKNGVAPEELRDPVAAAFLLEDRGSDDHLALTGNKNVRAMLEKRESGVGEHVIFSDKVAKLKPNKADERVLLITNAAIYNIKPSIPATYQRRIDLREVRSVTLSDKGDEFIVHVPSDYDYRFSSPRRAAALRALSIAYRTAARRELEGRVVALDTMASLVLERRQAQQKAAVRVSIVNGGTAPAAAAPADAAEQPHGALGWRGAALRKLRGLVSKKKKRYTENGADLDLSYITSRVIAMGFPADDFERFYRNPYTEVFALLEQKHGQHYFVYNLCSERRYSAAKFGGRVKEVPFDDHTPPRLSQMVEFCEHASRHLAADARNVIAVHCKAGKGRTGVMISCLLLYSGAAESAEGAMHMFGQMRTKDGKGVTIPSQKRFVKYFERYLRFYYLPRRLLPLPGRPLQVERIVLHTTPHFDLDGGSDPYCIFFNAAGEMLFDSRKLQAPQHVRGQPLIEVPCAAKVHGEFRVVFFDKDHMGSDKMCHFWLHTSFVDMPSVSLLKSEIDRAVKDKKHKYFDADFKIVVFFREDDVVPVRVAAADAPHWLGETATAASLIDRPAARDPAARLRELEAENQRLRAALRGEG